VITGVLEGTEYVVDETALRRNHTQWTAHDKWACLAGVAGMPLENIVRARSSAQVILL
jgi:hypothetical protein